MDEAKSVATINVTFTNFQAVRILNDISEELDVSFDELIEIAVSRFMYEFKESIELFRDRMAKQSTQVGGIRHE